MPFSYRPKRKRKSIRKAIIPTFCAILLVLGACAGNLYIKHLTNDRPLELALTGIQTPSEKFTIEAEQYKKEIEQLKLENDRLIRVSRGGNRELEERPQVTPTPVQEQFNNLERAISNNLKGVFHGKAPFIIQKCRKYNVNPMLLTAIMYHETANGSSVMVVNKNNPGGISTNSGGFVTYKSLESGIEAMIKLLKTNYIDKGLVDIQSIGNKYCPLTDKRDVNSLNQYWVPVVTQKYLQILEESK